MFRAKTVVGAVAVMELLFSGAAQATLVKRSGGIVQQVLTASDTEPQSTTLYCPGTNPGGGGGGVAKLYGAALNVTTPEGANQLLTARLTALGTVAGGNPAIVHGSVRILSGAKELLPAADFNYMVASSSDPQPVPIALERSGIVIPGSHTVYVQYCVYAGDGTQTFTLSNWHLTVEAAPVQ